MKLNVIAYYQSWDGYGRFSSRLVRALQQAGVAVAPLTLDVIHAPAWLQAQWGAQWDSLTISCMPPFMLEDVPGRHWLFTMTEGSVVLPEWVERINRSNVERVIVPCRHNAEAFQSSGVAVPVSVVPGGIDPHEFPALDPYREPHRPYTFLALADRNQRKGWYEVWDAFYKAFGGKTTGVQDVRLIVKSLPTGDNVTEVIAAGQDLDRRVVWQIEHASDMAAVYAQADCFVIPSRSEGWGMPHRECAAMGIPVITQAYSGLDDGHTREWALVVDGGRMQPIPKEPGATSLGEWRVADVEELAQWMRRCYERPYMAQRFGERAAAWLRQNQTWEISAQCLIDLIRECEPVEVPLVAA